jgi:hypothetical protein
MPFRCAQVRANRPCGSHPILSQKTKAISPGYGFERPRLISRAGSLSVYSLIERGTESSDTLRALATAAVRYVPQCAANLTTALGTAAGG